jgi:hypothetical protein
MAHNQKTITLITLVSLAVMATATTITNGKKYKNLKVLPQDITEKKLDSIMDAYSKALKVSCDFCHMAPKKDTFSITPINNELDFSLDNEMKENARRMMRMTIDINKNYFYFDSLVKPEYLNVVSCNICHRGNPFPVNE